MTAERMLLFMTTERVFVSQHDIKQLTGSSVELATEVCAPRLSYSRGTSSSSQDEQIQRHQTLIDLLIQIKWSFRAFILWFSDNLIKYLQLLFD